MVSKFNIKTSYILVLIFLASCGGGGGGGSNPAPTPPEPQASVTLTSDFTEIGRGKDFTLTWSSENASGCSASGDWTGEKGTSGSETLSSDTRGNLSFTLNCSGASSTVSVMVTQPYDTSAFIDNDQWFSGFLFHKADGFAGCMTSIRAELGIYDSESFYFKNFTTNEIQYLSYRESEQELGLSFNPLYKSPEGDAYFYLISSPAGSSTNTLILNTSDEDIYDNPSDTLERFEARSGNITLHFDQVEDNPETCWGADIEMSVIAKANSGNEIPDAEFVGTSYGADTYTFLYLVDDRTLEAYDTDQPSESSIFNHQWGLFNGYHSYQSMPNYEGDYAMRVSSDQITYLRATLSWGDQYTFLGSRLADELYSDGSVFSENGMAVKYIYREGIGSNQKMFLKMDISQHCATSTWYDCYISNREILFFTPSSNFLWGFGLGGYDGTPETTKVIYGGRINE